MRPAFAAERVQKVQDVVLPGGGGDRVSDPAPCLVCLAVSELAPCRPCTLTSSVAADIAVFVDYQEGLDCSGVNVSEQVQFQLGHDHSRLLNAPASLRAAEAVSSRAHA